MIRTLKMLGLVAILLVLPALAGKATALPVLQLDMAGGVYDPITETIVAPGGSFTVYAILTPHTGATAAEIAALLNTNYFLSVGLVPQSAPPGGSLGSFTFGPQGGSQSLVPVTTGMTYGVPPLETMAILQGFDPNDLAKHGIYPTYFSEFGFQFSPLNTTNGYNTATNPGGPTPSPTGTSYFAAFTGDSSLLAAGYQLHFDLYNETVRNCATRNSGPCIDVDVDMFAPFSHDAETRVPEASTSVMMLVGLLVGGRCLRRRTSQGN